MQEIKFGTDGIRGNADQFPFSDEALFTLGLALGAWMGERYQRKPATVLLGGDTRVSCDRIKKAIGRGLSCFATTVFDAGVIPTPAILTLVKADQAFDCGIMISASHNPYQDNGVKLFDAQLGKITARDEEMIIKFFSWYSQPKARENLREGLGSYALMPDAQARYVDLLAAKAAPHPAGTCKVVLDCAHGATFRVAPDIFRRLGMDVKVLHDQPTGTNINEHAGALHPEALREAVLEHRADIGFAFDGDGDRITVVSRHGKIKDGDDVVAALMDLPDYAEQKTIVGTVMSNSGFEDYVIGKGKHFVRTPVGDKYVVAKLEEAAGLLGGEPSGHVVLRDHLSSGDGILVALKVLEALAASSTWDMEHYAKRPQRLINVPVACRGDLKQAPYAQLIAEHEQRLGQGRVLVRFSGTENLLRVMVEGNEESHTELIARSLADALQQALENTKG